MGDLGNFWYFLSFHLLAFSIGYVMVFSIFAEDAVFEEKFAKQNGLFEEILHTIILISYYGILVFHNSLLI